MISSSGRGFESDSDGFYRDIFLAYCIQVPAVL
jgi:hypothetical protein